MTDEHGWPFEEEWLRQQAEPEVKGIVPPPSPLTVDRLPERKQLFDQKEPNKSE